MAAAEILFMIFVIAVLIIKLGTDKKLKSASGEEFDNDPAKASDNWTAIKASNVPVIYEDKKIKCMAMRNKTHSKYECIDSEDTSKHMEKPPKGAVKMPVCTYKQLKEAKKSKSGPNGEIFLAICEKWKNALDD